MKPKDFAIRISTFVVAVLIALTPVMATQVSAEDFTIIVLPDTQKYSAGYPEIYIDQTEWIVGNKDALNIVYVAHEGDIVDTASSVTQWDNADVAMSRLEDPVTTGLTEGIPYGVVPGNHDEGSYYNRYFGEDRFTGGTDLGTQMLPGIDRSYYGDGYPSGQNDSNYTLFSASGMDFIVINLDYTNPAAGLLDWADQLLKDNGDRRAIVVTHYILNTNGTFGSWGQQVYDALKGNPNLFLDIQKSMRI